MSDMIPDLTPVSQKMNGGNEKDSSERKSPLTRKQNAVLEFIKIYISDNGRPPTIKEIGDGVKISSLSTVHEHLKVLKDQGYIQKEAHKTRGIKLLKTVDDNLYLEPSEKTDIQKVKAAVRNVRLFLPEASYVLRLAEIKSKVRARSVSMHIINEETRGTILKPRVWLGCWDEKNKKPREFLVGSENQGIAGHAYSSRCAYIVGDVRKDEHYIYSEDESSMHIRSMLVMPIFDFDGVVIGVISLESNLENRFEGFHGLDKDLIDAMEEIGDCKYIKRQRSIETSVEIFLWLFDTMIS